MSALACSRRSCGIDNSHPPFPLRSCSSPFPPLSVRCSAVSLPTTYRGVGACTFSLVPLFFDFADFPSLFFQLHQPVRPLFAVATIDDSLTLFSHSPFGAITVAAILFILGPQPPPPMLEEVGVYTEGKFRRYTFGRWTPPRTSLWFRLFALDYIGTTLMLGTITCLLLPLQWGGEKYEWSSGIIGGLFGAFAALVVIMVLHEWKTAGPSRILPLNMFMDRTQIGACLIAFFVRPSPLRCSSLPLLNLCLSQVMLLMLK